MSILSDGDIATLALHHQMIAPFSASQHRDRCISWGLSSYGYDIRCGDTFHVFSGTRCGTIVVDPKAFDPEAFDTVTTTPDRPWVEIPPNSFALAESAETFRIPRDVLTLCVGKSTYARCGIIVNVTPFEPEWRGTATLEISNTTPLPARIYANEGIAQVLFFKAGTPCLESYADRKDAKYQDQSGIVSAKV